MSWTKNLWWQLVETGKLVYVKVINEQAQSKIAVVLFEDDGGFGYEPTHQHVQLGNQ
jgi:hypothetical protein